MGGRRSMYNLQGFREYQYGIKTRVYLNGRPDINVQHKWIVTAHYRMEVNIVKRISLHEKYS